ncbi:MBOAT, membrane-bound O-acyltransferase family-domain-containing protein [Globomyces pollinis-pini]|nr:MBOAT, membrane-bound O-acyltransferase family-domain-containing protein [Globomyces pollinis-pini]
MSTIQLSSEWKLGYLLFMNYLLSFVFAKITEPKWKHYFSIAVTTISFLFLNPFGYFQILLFITLCFNIITYNKHAYWMPVVISFLAMFFLGCNHIFVNLFDIQILNHSIPIMTTVIKIISFAWAVSDGNSHQSTLAKKESPKSIVDIPAVLDFYGFMLYFPTFIIGPNFSFLDYQVFVNKIPNQKVIIISFFETTFTILLPLIFLFRFGSTYNISKLLDTNFIESTSYLDRFIFVNMSGMVIRCGLFVGFKICEGACTISGFELSFQDERSQIEYYSTDESLSVVDSSSYLLMTSWNITSRSWLKEHVYDRLISMQISPTSSVMISYLVISYWSGVHLGIYLSFGSMLLLQSLTYYVKKEIRPRLKQYSVYPLFSLLGAMISQIFINFCVPTLILKSLYECSNIYSPMYLLAHFLIVSLIALFKIKRGFKGIHQSVEWLSKAIIRSTLK